MAMGTTRISHGGNRLILLPERAIYWASEQTLILADLHFGKSAEFRLRGIAVPEGDSLDSLNRVSALVRHHGCRRVLVLGDFFHGRAAVEEGLTRLFREWQERHPELEWILVPGNHDRHVLGGPGLRGITLADPVHEVGGLRFQHFPPEPGETAPVLCGHLHPAVCLAEDSGPRLRLPCFFRRGGTLVLPAFGSFTGAARIDPEPGMEIWGVVEDRVLEIPFQACR